MAEAPRTNAQQKKNAAEPTRDRSAATPSSDSLFLPLGLLGGGAVRSELEIIHPDGCRVRVIGEVNVASLAHVLAALDKRGA